MNDYSPALNLERMQHMLERRRLSSQVAVTRHARLSVEEDHLLDHMLYRLESEVLAERLVDQTISVDFDYCVPTSWWQHFKMDNASRWFMRRFVRRWPVIETERRIVKTATFTRYATFPHSTLEMPALGRQIIVESVQPGPTWRLP